MIIKLLHYPNITARQPCKATIIAHSTSNQINTAAACERRTNQLTGVELHSSAERIEVGERQTDIQRQREAEADRQREIRKETALLSHTSGGIKNRRRERNRKSKKRKEEQSGEVEDKKNQTKKRWRRREKKRRREVQMEREECKGVGGQSQ